MRLPTLAEIDAALDRLARPVSPAALAACGMTLLLLAHGIRHWAGARALEAGAHAAALAEQTQETAQALAEARSQLADRVHDLDSFKAMLPKVAEARRQVFEGGLQLQEEKRLLEKQLEIMTTYLLVDEEEHKVHVMRGEQSLETFPIGPDAPRYYGSGAQPPAQAAIVSKERFAHPERPKAEQVGEKLQWQPPQVGESVRANALGEFVVFTKGPLILHGPPKSEAEHAAFPHMCLDLKLPVAKRLYGETYIGTKVALKRAVELAERKAAKGVRR